MKHLYKILLALLLLPSLALGQVHNQLYGFGYGGQQILGMTTNGTVTINTDTKWGGIAVSTKGSQFVTPVDPSSGLSQSVIPVSRQSNLSASPTGNIKGSRNRGSDTVEAASTVRVLNLTAHAAKEGDIIKFRNGGNTGAEVPVCAIATNTVTLCADLEADPSAADIWINSPQNIASFGGDSLPAGGDSLAVALDSGYQLSAATGILKLESATVGGGDAGVASLFMAESAITASAATNQYINPKADTGGRTVVTNAPAGETFQSCGTATASTSDVSIKASVASNRMYVNAITCKNTSATVATSLDFKDGTTIIAVGGISQMAAGAAGSFTATFPTPLRGTAATAFQFATNVSVSSVTCCIAGYISTI